MANYVKTGPFVNGSAPGISATFLNNVENVFEAASGGTESGKWWLSGWSNASGDLIQVWLQSLSRTSAPVSVSVSTTTGPTNIAAVSNGQLGSGGFQIYSTSSSAQVSNLQAGGTYTIQY